MKIGAIQAHGPQTGKIARRKKSGAKPGRTAGPPRDTFESSADAELTAKLAKIKQRVKAGFYGSKEVTEDLSDSFAKVFDKLV
ncbi:MAG: hypothetical protein GF344_17490 [Chitinivibrionales bacterium]|nr:hypothetical protein [Chitinivibrionales bacterium]MBD3358459.1 hypothetical protein [Chitinivibrionales bacterium]